MWNTIFHIGNFFFLCDKAMKLGLPYKGSKNSIAQSIVAALPEGKSFVDGCCGGGAVVQAAAMSGKYKLVTGYDINKAIIALLERVMCGCEAPQPHAGITKEQFYAARDRNETIDDFLTRYIASFGYNGTEYLWSEERTPIKLLMHDIVCAEDFRTRRARLRDFCTLIMKGAIKPDDLKNYSHLEQVQNLERFVEVAETMAELYKSKKAPVMQFVNASMFDIPFEKYDVIYFDPPYKDTKGYNRIPFSHLMFTALLKTLKDAGKHVFVSEYNCPCEGYTEVWSVKKTMTQDAYKNTTVTEKLFYGGTLEEYKNLSGTLAEPDTGDDSAVHDDTDGSSRQDNGGEPVDEARESGTPKDDYETAGG